MSKPAGICLPAGFPGAPEAPSTPRTLDPCTTIFLVLLLLRDLLTLRRSAAGERHPGTAAYDCTLPRARRL